MTCRVCGHSTRRNENFTHTPDDCPHTITDKRGSLSRQCGSFIAEATMQFHKERVAIGKRIEKPLEEW